MILICILYLDYQTYFKFYIVIKILIYRALVGLVICLNFENDKGQKNIAINLTLNL